MTTKYTCSDYYNCCDCGEDNCGCPYCWSCNACDTCKECECFDDNSCTCECEDK